MDFVRLGLSPRGVWVVSLHAAQESAQILAMAAPPDRTSVGVEPSGCVWVGMRSASLDGALTVAVAPDWRARLNPADFGQALARATADAVHRRAEAWAEQLTGHLASPFSTSTEASWTEAPPVRVPENLDAFVRLVIDAYDELDAVVAAIDQAVTEPAHGRSDDGRICVIVQCGTVTEVRVDQRWLATAPADVLGDHAGQALRSAFAAAERAVVEPLRRSAALRDLRNTVR
jgi:hypothetical protein